MDSGKSGNLGVAVPRASFTEWPSGSLVHPEGHRRGPQRPAVIASCKRENGTMMASLHAHAKRRLAKQVNEPEGHAALVEMQAWRHMRRASINERASLPSRAAQPPDLLEWDMQAVSERPSRNPGDEDEEFPYRKWNAASVMCFWAHVRVSPVVGCCRRLFLEQPPVARQTESTATHSHLGW